MSRVVHTTCKVLCLCCYVLSVIGRLSSTIMGKHGFVPCSVWKPSLCACRYVKQFSWRVPGYQQELFKLADTWVNERNLPIHRPALLCIYVHHPRRNLYSSVILCNVSLRLLSDTSRLEWCVCVCVAGEKMSYLVNEEDGLVLKALSPLDSWSWASLVV